MVHECWLGDGQATPGRLVDMAAGEISLANVTYLVLDEADGAELEEAAAEKAGAAPELDAATAFLKTAHLSCRENQEATGKSKHRRAHCT